MDLAEALLHKFCGTVAELATMLHHPEKDCIKTRTAASPLALDVYITNMEKSGATARRRSPHEVADLIPQQQCTFLSGIGTHSFTESNLNSYHWVSLVCCLYTKIRDLKRRRRMWIMA